MVVGIWQGRLERKEDARRSRFSHIAGGGSGLVALYSDSDSFLLPVAYCVVA